MKLQVVLLLLFVTNMVLAQKATIMGSVVDQNNRAPIPNATVHVVGAPMFAVSDSLGQWILEVEPGLYNLEVNHINYQKTIFYEYRAAIVRPNVVELSLEQLVKTLPNVTVTSAKSSAESEEIQGISNIRIDALQRMPGTTLDISKVLKALPGVSPKVSFGYNLITRGGASFENTYYLDGIKIPFITHFNVQGLSGGPNGLINTDLIESARFNTGDFPIRVTNTLSSVLDMKHKRGRTDRIGGKFTLGASEYGLHLEGPLGKKSSYIASFRKSYTEYLLKAFNVPVIPFFYDFQYHHNINLTKNDKIDLYLIGAKDKYRLNKTDKKTDALLYNTGYIPEGDQALQVGGIKYTHLKKRSVYSFILSHNRLNNGAFKYLNNSYKPEDLVLRYHSKDYQTHLQYESKHFRKDQRITYGVNYIFNDFTMNQFNIRSIQNGQLDSTSYDSKINYAQYGFFVSYSNKVGNKMQYKVSTRFDGATFSKQMANLLEHIAPRFSMQYAVTDQLTASVQTGIFYQLPPNSILAYKENNTYVNQPTMDFIRSYQVNGGMHFKSSKNRSVSIDGFYKKYDKYPFLLNDSISFANASGEYVVVGNQHANSSNKGYAYGVELYYRQHLHNNWFGNLTASYIISKFQSKKGTYIPSAWDSRYFANIIIGKKWKSNWQIGAKWTIAGANPYTPFDKEKSSLKSNWDINKRGLLDFDQLNTKRLPIFHQMDFRVDKTWYLNKMTIIFFLDIQNLYSHKFQILPYLTVQRDDQGNPITDPLNSDRYLTEVLQSDTGRVLPTIGFSLEF